MENNTNGNSFKNNSSNKEVPKKKSRKKLWITLIIIFVLLLTTSVFAYNVFIENSVTVKKPAIYLYPTSDSQIKVTLDINGKIINDIPKYKNGWDVFVTKEGIIENQYDYLFYENTLNTIELPEEGWIVKKKDLYKWFDEYLPKLGLNEKEKIQFKEYWLHQLVDSEYYEIKLFSKDFLNKNMKLNVTPKADTTIRLIFNFKGISDFYEIKNPEIIMPERIGFTVVEWGGMIENK